MQKKKEEKSEKGDQSKKMKVCPKCKRLTNMFICTCGQKLYQAK